MKKSRWFFEKIQKSNQCYELDILDNYYDDILKQIEIFVMMRENVQSDSKIIREIRAHYEINNAVLN